MVALDVAVVKTHKGWKQWHKWKLEAVQDCLILVMTKKNVKRFFKRKNVKYLSWFYSLIRYS